MANQLEYGIKRVFDWYGGYEFDFVMWMEMENRLFNVYMALASDYSIHDSFVQSYASEFARDITETTQKKQDHFSENNETDMEYIVSLDRARNAARNEVNRMENRRLHDENIVNGHRFHQWITILDGHERNTHWAVAYQINPINEPFIVGGYMMMFPMDESLGAPMKEILGCRCVEKFM